MKYVESIAIIACALMLTACCGPVRADDAPSVAVPGDDASRAAQTLVDEVLRQAGGGGKTAGDSLGDWTRSMIERALERAGRDAEGAASGRDSQDTPAPLSVERHAGRTAAGLAGRANTADIIVFTSLSVPAESWRQWAAEASAVGAPLVLRGVGEGGMRATAKRIGTRIGAHKVGVAIDPRLFRLFAIERVPAVIVVPGGAPPCASRGCSNDPAPPHDRVSGNIGLVAALEAVAAEGDAGRGVAKGYLERLVGDGR